MKKIFAIILAMCMLSGCTLAAQLPGGQPMDDELTGFLLTVSLTDGETATDIWDTEALGMEPLHLIGMEGEKLYAKRVGGEPVTYAFPEGAGLSCFCYYVFSDVEGESYRASTNDPELADVTREVHVSSGATNYLEATVYATADSNAVLYLNPVYQTPEGEVYALGTAPMGIDAASMDGYAQTLTQETKIQMGEQTSLGGTVKLTIRHVTLPEHYTVIEMDADNQPLRQSTYAPDAMPETYIPGADAAYLILEAAGETITRTVYSPDDADQRMDTYYPGQYGLCIKGYTVIKWEGAE